MKTIPADLLEHMQEGTTSIATCWKVTLQGSPAVVLGFTDHDQDLTVSGVTYLARSGFMPTAYETQTKMAVDNLQAQGFIDNDIIDEQDLLNGLWDFAQVEIFQLNFKSIDDGIDVLTKGHLGQISLERGKFEAELRGIANAFTQARNRVYQPLCRVEFGSTECSVNLSAYTETGTVTSVSANGIVLFDTSRTEPGPAGKTITAITKAANASVTCAAHGFLVGQYVFFHGIEGMTQMNGEYGVVQTRATNSFTVNINSTNFGTFTTGSPNTATVSADGAGGYFAAIAHRQELVGQISLALARQGVMHDIVAPRPVVRFCSNQHVEELGQSFYSPSAPGFVGGVDTVIRREMGRIKNVVSLLFQDECFPAGTLIRTPIDDIRIARRQTQGVTVFRVGEGERVVSVARLGDLGGDETNGDAASPETDGSAEVSAGGSNGK
jgi:hypothetical protein